MVWLRIRRWVVRPFFWSLAFGAFVLLCLRAFLASDLVRDRLAARIEQQLSQILKRQVSVGRLDFELLPFALRLEEFSISGPGKTDPPLLSVRRLRVDADLDALRQDILDLQTVSAEGVRLHLELDEHGGDNLPALESGDGGGRFAVRIGGLYVDDGEFVLADHREPLHLEAHALLLRLAGLGGTELQGTVTAQEVVTTLPGARPWPATISAKARLRDDRVEILRARLRSSQVEAEVEGTVGWRGGTHGELRTRLDAQGSFLDDLGYLSGEIAGPIRFDGDVRFVRKEIGIRGRLTSPGIDLLGLRLEELDGRVESTGERVSGLRLDLERAVFAAGPISGSFAVDFERPGPLAHLALEAAGPHLDEVLATLDLPAPSFAAGLYGPVAYDFRFDDALHGSGSAELELRALPLEPGGAVPANGATQLRLLDGRLEIVTGRIEAGSQQIDLSGAYDLAAHRGELSVDVASEEFAELARLQPFFATDPWPIWLPNRGRGDIGATVKLEGSSARVQLGLDLERVHAPGVTAARVHGGLTVETEAVRDLDLEFEEGGATLAVRGFVPLAEVGIQAPPLALEVDFRGWSVEDASPWLPAPLPIAGPATGALALGGSLAALRGDLRAEVAPAKLFGIEVASITTALIWDSSQLSVREAVVHAPTGLLRGTGELRFADESLGFDLRAERLELGAEPWRTLSGERLSGQATLVAKVDGTLAAPHLVVDADLANLSVPWRADDFAPSSTPPNRTPSASAPPIAEERFGGRMHAELAHGELEATLDLPGLLTARGGGTLSGEGAGQFAFRVASDRLDRLVALAAGAPLPGLAGKVGADLRIRLAKEGPASVEIAIPELEVAYEGHRLAPLEPVSARFENSRLTVASLYLGEPGTSDELFLAGDLDLSAADPALDLRLQASLSVDWLERLAGLDLTGQIDLLTTVKGTLAHPAWNGQADLRDARFIPERFPHSFDRVEGLLLLYPEVLVLDHLRADLAGGTVVATGKVELPTAEKALTYRAQIATRRTALRYPEGWLMRGDGDLTLQSTADGRQISGTLALDRIFYVQDINLSPRQLAERVLSRTRVQVDEADELLGTTYLNVSVVAPHAVRVRNNMAKLGGSANLALRGSLANPLLFGEMTTDPGGTIDYNGATYTLDRAVVTFANPSRIEPLLDVVARTKINEYQVTLSVLGSLARPTTTLGSEPPLPDYDVLSLLATGSTSGLADLSESPESGTQPGMAAESLLYGQAASLVSARVGKLFGIDRLKVDPLAGGDSLSAARVTVGKRLSSRVYLTYSVDPSSTAQQVLQVEWKLSDDLTLVLTQNGDESYAVDARWERRF